jgi:hypothetical protein
MQWMADAAGMFLTGLRADPGKATTVLRALLVLTRQHTTR